jgi:diguanylate cyclase (GGDEF)-like protein
VARFGGDEFVVMLGKLSDDKAQSRAQAGQVAEKIRVALNAGIGIFKAPYQLTVTHSGQSDTTVQHHCSVSIGVVVFINADASQADLMQWADAAMYQAKDAGRNAIRFHEPAPALPETQRPAA